LRRASAPCSSSARPAASGLTEAGERFLARARPAFEELVAASGAARELGQRPVGLLRLTIPRSVVPILLEPLVASFCRAFPEIEVELAASEELVDLAAEGFDAGIRLGDNGSSFGQARPPAVTTDGHRSHQFRTRNDRAKAQQTRSNSNESAVKSMKLVDLFPLITVWLQVRVLPGPPHC